MTPADIRAAAARLRPYLRRTPIVRLSGPVPCELKLETMQHAGSFETRGVFNALLLAALLDAGVAAPGGNLGAAVAFAARVLRRPASIFVPRTARRADLAALEAALPDIHFGGDTEAEARAACAAFCALTGAVEVSTAAAATVAGYGTLAAEWDAQTDGLDTVLVAADGGGLAIACEAWFAGRTRVVGVQSDRPRTPGDAWPGSGAGANIGADASGARPFAAVPEGAILDAQRLLWREGRIVAERNGATAYAALLSGAYTPAPGERVGVLVGSGNVDLAAFAGVAG